MTHSLHRQGTPADLSDDFPMLTIRAKGFNDGSLWRMQRVLEMAAQHPIVNYGDIKQGSKFTVGLEQILTTTDPQTPIIHMVFTNREDALAFLEELRAADLGISVVASGLLDELFDCCREAGLEPHTVSYSLGVFGDTERLPPQPVLDVTTMCGHSLVAAALVKKLAADVRDGRLSPEKAAERLAKNCVCGIFNPKRAARLLTLIAP